MAGPQFWVAGVGSQSWAAANNWSATAGGAGGNGPPGAGDSVYILTGQSIIDQGLSQTTNLALLVVTFGGSIGNSGTSLALGTVTSATFNCSGEECNLNATFTTLKHNGGNLSLTGGTTTTYLGGSRGKLTVGASATITTCKNEGMTIEAAAGTAFTLLKSGGGTVSSSRNITEGYIHGGCVLKLELAAVIVGTSGRALDIGPGSTFVYNSSGTTLPSSSGAIVGMPGSLAMVGPYAVSGTAITTEAYGDANLFLSAPIALTITNTTVGTAEPG